MKRSFDNIKYGSYPQNDDFDNLPIEYKKGFSHNEQYIILLIIK